MFSVDAAVFVDVAVSIMPADRRTAGPRNQTRFKPRCGITGKTMEMPRRFNTYCPHCDGHREVEVEKVRRGRSSGTKWDARRTRRRTSVIGNAGRFSKVPGGDKPTKKTNLKYRCSDCGKAHLREGWRAGRLEFQE